MHIYESQFTYMRIYEKKNHKCAYMESWLSYMLASVNAHIRKLVSIYACCLHAHSAHIRRQTYVYAHLQK
jgi:hypothetical protein